MQFLPKISLAEWMLRAGLALSFLYPPIDAWGDAYSWIGYFPALLTDLVAPHGIVLLHLFGVVEIVLALWILVGKNVRLPALIAALLLLAIVVFNLPQMQVLFRDLTIALMAVALAYFPRSSTPHA